MLSTTLKRAAATLGVLTGLLAAVAPASAQILDGPVMLDTPRANSTWGVTGWPDAPLNDAHGGPKAPAGAVVGVRENGSQGAVKAFTASGGWDPTHAAAEQTWGPVVYVIEAIDFNALGTQVGSEGVKDKRRGFFDIPAELNTFGGNDTLRAPGTAIGVINDLLDA